MIQAAAKGMIESKVENGSIVSIGSISGKVTKICLVDTIYVCVLHVQAVPWLARQFSSCIAVSTVLSSFVSLEIDYFHCQD